MVHNLDDFSKFFVSRQLLSFKVEIVAQFPEAQGAEGERLLVSLVELRRAVHEALVMLTVANGQHVAQFVAGCLDRSVLYNLGHFGVKHPTWLVRVPGEVWMMTRIALNTDAPTLLGHAEDEGPAVFRVQVGVRQHEQALVLIKFHVVFQILENVASVELLHASVTTYTRLHYASPFQLGQILFNMFKF